MRMQRLQLKGLFLDIGLRFIVGIIFLIAGISKLPMHSEFAEIVMAYKILPFSLAHLYILVLPWLEITIGSCLILGLLTRPFSLVSIPVIASFIVANVIGLLHNIAECPGCFGELITVSHEGALVIDALLLVGVSVIFFQRRRFMALDSWLTRLFRFNRQHFV